MSDYASNRPCGITPEMLEGVASLKESVTLLSRPTSKSGFAPRNYPHTPEQIAQELRVDEEGRLWWRRQVGTRNMSKSVGYIDHQGKAKNKPYVRLSLNKVSYKRSVIVFCLHHGRWPDSGKVIDHIDGDSLNDCPLNLREISQQENTTTSRLRSDNTSGFKGVSFVSRLNRYEVYLNKNGKKINGGYYDTKEEAIAVRAMLEKVYEHNPVPAQAEPQSALNNPNLKL